VTEQDNIEPGSIQTEDAFEDALAIASPVKNAHQRRRNRAGSESDTDFQAESDDESEPEPDVPEQVNPNELDTAQRNGHATAVSSTPKKQLVGANAAAITVQTPQAAGLGTSTKFSSNSIRTLPASITVKGPPSRGPVPPPPGRGPPTSSVSGNMGLSPAKPGSKATPAIKPFKRINLPMRSPLEPTYGSRSNRVCAACLKMHPSGACELKAAGVEHCGLCGLAHFGHSRTCPHIKSETQVREMLEALKHSPEKKELVDAAVKYLRGVKGTLVQQKKRDREKAAAALNGGPPLPPAAPKPHASANNSGKYVPPHMPAGASAPLPVGSSSAFPNGPPQREVPSWYNGPDDGTPGPSRSPWTAVEFAQMQANGGHANEEVMESALRGFLGH
jgi:chromodomain-helicase-DNA-binding protein 4